MRFSFYIYAVLLLNHGLRSQDIHFSQFNENLALINPAMIGVQSSLKVSITNRDQWRTVAAPYKTMGANFESRFNADDWQQKKSKAMFATGVSLYRDKVGDGYLGQTQGNLSISTFLAVDKQNFLSVGLQGSVVQKMTDKNKFLFPNQYNGNVYDPNQASNENFANVNFTYFDVGAGAQWTYSREQKTMDAYKQFTSHFGFAAFHLSRPSQQYLASMSRLYIKYISHGDLIASIGDLPMAISPSYLVQLQGSSKEIIAGATMRHYIRTDSKYTGIILRDCFGYGIHYRSKDALILSALFEWKEKLGLIMSYDMNLSSLSSASSYRGGLEFTLRYTAPKSFFYQREAK